jgi:hypothetical protein
VRKKLIIATTAGVLTLGGVAVAVPVLADTDPAAATERIREALIGLVEDGSITDEQADEVAATLSEAGLGGRHGHGGGRPALDTAADALGMTEDELREALQAEDTSLADVAEAQGVAVDTLIQALVDAQEERIAGAVEDGRLTQEEADERLADLEDRVTELVNSDELPRGGPGRGHGRHGD